ncbi:MAG TPA: O-antigen polysaccharide polymerase Wzy [Pyrinomonadaceae bacterium]|nr:O-antigen polysaccharide polymerase Wzy [Pyrinomonadaceae bacterium]
MNALASRLKATTGAMHLFLLGSVGLLIVGPLILSEYGYLWTQVLLALLLLEICLIPSVVYLVKHDSSLPTMPVFCIAYALQFAFPILTQEDTFLLMGGEIRYLAEREVVIALLLAIAGICSLQLGYYRFQRSNFRKVIPVAHLPLKKSRALAYCALVGIFLPLLFTFQSIIPEEFQQPLSAILRVLQNQVLVVIAILGWLYYGCKESRFYAFWMYGLVLIAAMRGISAGSLEEAVVPFGIFFVVKWLYTGRVPVTPVLVTALLVVFLSPAKSDYRQRAWFGDEPDLAEQSSLTKGKLWINQATEYWADTISGNRDFAEATSSATGRADFIHQVAYIYSMTPSVVPYQYGKTYSFFLVSFIPRIIWPDKPTAGSANGFYAVTYGVTTEEGAKTTTFGVSILGEAFMNFGWPGVILIMLVQGILIGAMQHSFGGKRSGPGGQAVFLCFFVYFLNGIGSSAEIMFGGILQNLLMGYVLLLWARKKPSKIGQSGVRRVVEQNA